MKVALVHDYLREYGGAERVLEALHEIYPEAPVYVGFYDKDGLGKHVARFEHWELRETWISRLPFYKRLYSPYRIFAPSAFASLDLSAFDVVISSSNAYFAKNVRVQKGKHFCYCHTPPRALYGYSTMSDWKANPFTRIIGSVMNHFLRVVDYYSAQKVDVFIANSQETAHRIAKFYRRESVVINPPVQMADTALLTDAKLVPLSDRDYYLYVNRLALAKHPELAVAVCSKLQLPLKVVGSGKMESRLKKMAGSTVQFLGSVTDVELQQLYAGAKALLYPVEDEDFGMVPVEAMACGTPVVAHRSGGPKETVQDGKTGVFFSELTESGLETALRAFQELENTFSETTIAQSTSSYTKLEFARQIRKLVKS